MSKNNIPELSDEDIAAVTKPDLSLEDIAAVAPNTMGNQVETALRSTAEGLSAGFSEPAVSGSIAIKNLIKDAVAKGSLDQITADNFWKSYDKDVQDRLIQKEQNPGLDIGGQVVGAVAPILLTGGAALGLRGAAAAARAASVADVGSNIALRAGKLATAPLAKAAQLAEGTRLAGTAKLGVSAAEHAAGAVAQEATRQGVLKSTGFMKPGEGPDFDEVAMVGAALPVVGKGVGALAKGAKVVGKGAMKVALGVSENDIQNYVKNYDKIQTARNVKEIESAMKDNLSTIKKVGADSAVDLSDDIIDNIELLKNRVSKSSSEAFDILDAADAAIPSKSLADAIRKSKENLYVSEGKTFGPKDAASVQYLENLAQEVEALGDDVPPSAVKKIIQSIRGQTEYLGPGQFDTPFNKSLKMASRDIDEQLKTAIPEYRDKMKEVAAMTSTLEHVVGELGSDQKALTGAKAAIAGSNPVKERAVKALAAYQPLDLEQAKQAAQMASELNLLNESNIGDKLSLFVKGSNDPKIRDQIEKLANLTDDQMVQELAALRSHEAFNKEFIRGSKNVNAWTVIGAAAGRMAFKGAAGAIVGSEISPEGAMLGAAWGASVDMFGPRMARAILKGIMQIKGIPTVAKIRALDAPEDVKRVMIQDLARALRPSLPVDKTQEKELNSFYAPEASRPVIASEIRRASDLSPEQKAEMIQSLNKTGRVVDFDKVVFAAEDKKPKQPSLVKTKDTKPAVPSDRVQEYFDYKKRQSY